MDAAMRDLVDKLEKEQTLQRDEFETLLGGRDDALYSYVMKKARRIADAVYGRQVFVRGLIEFSNYCKNNCRYCGIRRGRLDVERYRLSVDEILACCETGAALGFQTFVLQSGEDFWYTDEVLSEIVKRIHKRFPDCAITLSLGERDASCYQRLFEEGAQRYLLRHETADPAHYGYLHPEEMSLTNRKQCLWNLKKTGYQVGTGFMVHAPGQTPQTLAQDFLFIRELSPQMVGIGPFVPAQGTPFEGEPAGTLEETLYLLGLLRIMMPEVLLPATTALGTIHPRGRELGILAGANVVMPNLSPVDAREKYKLYDNKLYTGAESAQGYVELQKSMRAIGYELVSHRGDSLVPCIADKQANIQSKHDKGL